MQVVLRGACWLQFWSLMQREDTRETIQAASKQLEVVALDIFVMNGWRSNNRLCLWFFPLVNFYFYCSDQFISWWICCKTLVVCVIAEAGNKSLFSIRKLEMRVPKTWSRKLTHRPKSFQMYKRPSTWASIYHCTDRISNFKSKLPIGNLNVRLEL
jgi:hypothetical protein